MSRRSGVALGVVTATLALGGCGSGGEAERPRLIVSAAASLQGALDACTPGFPGADVKASFAGSDELAAQIRQGVRPDLFLAANTRLPEQLAREGRLDRPRVFATNELVLAVPAGAGRVRGIEYLTAPGLRLAVGSPTVPVGDYTSRVLGRLPPTARRQILANVRTEEPDVRGVVGKLTQRAVDAGFVYRSDVTATNGRLRAVVLPERLRPLVAYAGAVVRGARQPGPARRLLDDLISGRCATALRRAGFGPGPR